MRRGFGRPRVRSARWDEGALAGCVLDLLLSLHALQRRVEVPSRDTRSSRSRGNPVWCSSRCSAWCSALEGRGLVGIVGPVGMQGSEMSVGQVQLATERQHSASSFIAICGLSPQRIGTAGKGRRRYIAGRRQVFGRSLCRSRTVLRETRPNERHLQPLTPDPTCGPNEPSIIIGQRTVALDIAQSYSKGGKCRLIANSSGCLQPRLLSGSSLPDVVGVGDSQRTSRLISSMTASLGEERLRRVHVLRWASSVQRDKWPRG